MNIFARGVGYVYRRTLRPLFPVTEPVRYAGVSISRDRRWLDGSLPSPIRPFNVHDIPDYEDALARGIEAHVRAGDRVVVIGGGEGVTVVLAAIRVASTGSVVCYEGARYCVERTNATVKRNGLDSRVTVHHAVVAEAIAVYGHKTDAAIKIVKPTELPECDVLELDCEGAEVSILTKMSLEPRAVLVETHGVHGAPTAAVRDLLAGRGYEVTDLGFAEPSRLQECIDGDIRVLAAVRN